jgi:hypothetical protein
MSYLLRLQVISSLQRFYKYRLIVTVSFIMEISYGVFVLKSYSKVLFVSKIYVLCLLLLFLWIAVIMMVFTITLAFVYTSDN